MSPDSKQLSSSGLLVSIGVGIGMIAGSAFTQYLVARKREQQTLDSRPVYKPGQTPTLPTPNFGKSVEIFDPSKLQSCYNLMISTVTPRPIALVSSRNPDTGCDNVAPFSYFGAVAHDPPMIAIGFCRKGREIPKQKDSLTNILKSRTFGVHIISEWYLDAANHSCGMWDPEIDEFKESGMTKVTDDVEVAKASRVKEAAVMYECQLEYVHPVTNTKTGKPTTEIVLARVVRIHVDKEVLVDNYDPLKPAVDTMKLKPVGRLGGNIYSTLGETVDIPRPKVS